MAGCAEPSLLCAFEELSFCIYLKGPKGTSIQIPGFKVYTRDHSANSIGDLKPQLLNTWAEKPHIGL